MTEACYELNKRRLLEIEKQLDGSNLNLKERYELDFQASVLRRAIEKYEREVTQDD